MKKILNILIHDAPYKSPVIDKLYKIPDVKFQNMVLYNSPTTHKEWNLENKANYKTFSNITLPIFGDLHLGVLREIKKFEPDLIIISGYYPIINLYIILYCLKNNIKYLYGFDTVEKSKNKISNFINKHIMKNAEALFINGNKSIKFVSETLEEIPHLINGFYCLDVEQERSMYESYKSNRKKNREKLGIEESSFVFLFVGKLIKSRRLLEFLKFNFSKLDDSIVLLVIGDGPESTEVDLFVHKFKKRIIHISQTNYSELYKYYSVSDAYFHPGKEPYSLALVQAIICELPIVSSTDVGATWDFVKNSKNGYLVTKNEIDKYFIFMNLIKDRKYDCSYIKNEYRNVKTAYDIDKIALNIKKLVMRNFEK
ncbi:glycosyltransferase [Thomasclavelia cocleata]|jgi:glycosyltransferase involved in cell wall biosynthesis|uniref:glycosyltransferase n=1 Tax=Thomasclavelia cocleata TaxID=69824 RepID=UPI002430F846|nr:glycosyltransferase [Thomasclavelia cocleata]MCI9630307.1 glycosyltransferase family 4 protein [Thomasclavelia cocleata]